MKEAQRNITEFMQKAGQETPDKPTMPSREIRELRIKLIAEEFLELCEALDVDVRIERNRASAIHICGVDAVPSSFTSSSELEPQTNMVEAFDAVLDIMVVTVGTGVAMGLPLQKGWDEVHRSNMSKFIDGHRREDGKWVKGPSYSPAKLQPIIDVATG